MKDTYHFNLALKNAMEANMILDSLKRFPAADTVAQGDLLDRVDALARYAASKEETDQLRAEYEAISSCDPDEL